ncbi:50S ribosomal protein L24 [Candidatus Woesearchaeota archaeon]|nr:50S ribosomal protein L24 [Candidatus Woesearchaeota archaeon]
MDSTPTWKGSVQPRKQRKWLAQAPLHARNAFMSAPLVKPLRQKLGTRNIPVRKGDKVKVLRGQFKGKIGAVQQVNTKRRLVFIEGVDFTRKNGSKVQYGVHPSKVIITELHEDKRRLKHIQQKKETKKVETNG